jgi:hypothetical protein
MCSHFIDGRFAMVRRAVVVAVGFALASSIVACGSGDMAAPGLAPCTGDVSVKVDLTTATPEFTWAPACRLSHLAVFHVPGHDQTDLGPALWRLQSSTLLAPPIQYGVVPADAQAIAASALSPGEAYVIVVDRDTSGIVVSEGGATFIR